MKENIIIKNISHTRQGGVSRISAEVAGEVVWFESTDIELKPRAEGIASAFLVPALHKKKNIVIGAVVDKVWLSNMNRAVKQFHKWWKYRKISISTVPGQIPEAEKGHKTALCFSGGVDSFYNLLRGSGHIDYLVFIYGYDIALKDSIRLDVYLPSLKEIARQSGARLIIIKTNLREHNFFRSVSWERTFGSALAAIGYFIEDVGKLIISASYVYEYGPAWGSHWKTDPLFSSSGLEITHEGASVWRNQKIYDLADEPLVRKHLRVCWERRNELMNCCQCEKCIRTMLALKLCKKLDHFEAFPLEDNLIEYINKLPHLERHLKDIYIRVFVYKGAFEPALEKAVYALIKRSCRGLEVFQFYLRYFLRSEFSCKSPRQAL
jgi:hypothetical protein